MSEPEDEDSLERRRCEECGGRFTPEYDGQKYCDEHEDLED